MKIATISEVRPHFIKAGMEIRTTMKHNQLKDGSEKLEEVIIHIGQYFDKNMNSVFFEQMKIPKPDYNLNINGFGHGVMTGQMLEKIEEILLKEKPDWVIVYEDTNSTCGNLSCKSKWHI